MYKSSLSKDTARGDRVLGAINAIAQYSAFFGVILLLFVSFAVTENILMRWIFSAPLNGVGDLAGLASTVAISAALSLCVVSQGNIKVDLLGKALRAKANRWFDALGATVLLIVLFGMAWQLVPFAAGKMAAGETTWILGLKVAPWWWAVVVFFWIAVLCQGEVLYRLVSKHRTVNYD